ncbi:unnamed protein product [Brachionus calyciflorus]|uniref:Uncharacterized protein n=1 Tax=Brachionus calyciflorus TaxID=104777 RepID=A0A813M0G2_9BILA|nr:unnamed protein product [Brachionus calyciflorus]
MLDANNHVNQPTDPGQSPKSKSPKPKFYKIKNELENYDLLYLIHNEIPTGIFDIYMDFLPSTIKKIYLFVFNSSKVIRPHLFFMLYNHFDINVTLMNYSLFTNELSKPMVQTYVKEIDSKIKNSKLTYTDCSNISADLYLKNNLNLTSILNTNKSMLGVNNQDCKILKSNKNKPKSKYLNILFNKIAEFILSIPKTSRIKIVKRNSFNLNNNNLNSTSASIISLNNFVLNTNLINLTNLNYIQHKCQKDAVNLREETELFRFEFNLRFKECFLRSFESIFFTFILSRICVPEFINVRNQEFLVYLTSTIFCTFISYFTYYIPMSFLISLSRNAEHLGRWICEDDNETDTSKASNFSFSRSNISNMPFTPGKWSNSKLYFENDRVSHLESNFKNLKPKS